MERFLRKKLENMEKELINRGKTATIICITQNNLNIWWGKDEDFQEKNTQASEGSAVFQI